MVNMKASAAYLCDSVLCSLASHYEVKTVVVKDKQVVLFEHETFIFEKKTSWQITFHDQTFDCSFDCALQIQLTDFSELEIRLYRLHSSLLKPSVIPLKQQLIFGSGTQCDVQLADCFSDQVVELSFFADTLHYHVFQDAVCAVNGKPAASIGELHTPALLQIEHFSLFILQDGVAYNGGFVSRRVELPFDIPEIQRRYEVHSKYIPVCPIEDFSFREPEFCTLPQHQTASFLSMAPMLTMSCASLLSAWMSFQHSQNSSALIMPVMMLISAVFWPLCSAWKENRKQKRLKQERRKMYLAECEQIKKQIQEEKKRIHMNLVCPEALKREDFWQVRPNHPQFLKLPLGKGKLSLPYSIIAHQQHPDSSESDCHQALKKLHEESRMLDDALVSCDLQIHRCISFISNKKAIRETAEKIIIAMGSLMCLKEVHYVLFSNDEQLQWDLRKTSLFQFQHQQLIFDESVDSADAQKVLKQLDLTRTICFVQEQILFNRISNDIRNQVKTVYFLSHDDIVPPVCSTVYHVSSDGVIEEGLIKLPFHQGVKKRKEELMKLKFQCQKRTIHRDFLSYYSELSVERLLWMWESEAEPCALLGSNDFGEPIYFSLSEHEEGPHGLIAGTSKILSPTQIVKCI